MESSGTYRTDILNKLKEKDDPAFFQLMEDNKDRIYPGQELALKTLRLALFEYLIESIDIEATKGTSDEQAVGQIHSQYKKAIKIIIGE